MAKNFSCLIFIYFFVRDWTCPGTSLHPPDWCSQRSLQQQLWPTATLHMAAVIGCSPSPFYHTTCWCVGRQPELGQHPPQPGSPGGPAHPRRGPIGLLRTVVLYTIGGATLWPLPWTGWLWTGFRYVLLHGKPWRLCRLFATRRGLERWAPFLLPGWSGWVLVLPPHPHLRGQRVSDHESVRGALVHRGTGAVGAQTVFSALVLLSVSG